jgi:hypothetical protein
VLSGEDRVRPEAGAKEPLKLPFQWLLPLPAIFLVSAMLPFFGQPTHKKYLGAICLAFIFTGLMIFYLGYGLRYVYTAGTSQDVLALGFATIYQGTYVKDVPPEWLFSFTAPPVKATTTPGPEAKPAAENALAASAASQTAAPATADPPAGGKPSGPGGAAKSAGGGTAPAQAADSAQAKTNSTDTPQLDQGFGAPLWVLLVSVLGAGVLTVSMIVEEITQISDVNKKPLAEQPEEIRKHLQTLVQHQFFILFAPITAIFVYQIMIAGSAAKSTFTVALAALGAGPSLSALLTKAGAAAAKALAGSKS